ncbi:hypothetical protein BVRB_9g213410 [Beta vulgaris subsp. vulgaris]|nr:hypothetical protein BVRB_9g213410 [Beta vulgaris subsp. vulgaris]
MPGQEAMDQIMGAIDKMKQSLIDEIAAQGAQFKKEIEQSQMLSNTSISRKPRQSDIGGVAKQLNTEGTFQSMKMPDLKKICQVKLPVLDPCQDQKDGMSNIMQTSQVFCLGKLHLIMLLQVL